MLVYYYTIFKEVAHMKKTNFKKFIVACVATFTFIGVHNNKVEASAEDQVINKGQHTDQTTVEETSQASTDTTDWINIEEMLQKENNPFVVAIESLIPITTNSEYKLLNGTNQGAQTREIEANTLVKEPVKPAVTISEAEQDLFARLVEAEAKGEPYEGKLAVATVVLNRVDSPEFPNSITDVIYEVVGKSYAFSPVQNGEINKPASDEAKQAVNEALTRKDRVNDSIYFYNPEIATDEWIRSRPVDTTIGNHTFAK